MLSVRATLEVLSYGVARGRVSLSVFVSIAVDSGLARGIVGLRIADPGHRLCLCTNFCFQSTC